MPNRGNNHSKKPFTVDPLTDVNKEVAADIEDVKLFLLAATLPRILADQTGSRV